MAVDWQPWISVNTQVMHGQPCIAGTRIPVAVVLANLAAGLSDEQLLAEYPTLRPEAIKAALAYAAQLAQDETELLPAAGE